MSTRRVVYETEQEFKGLAGKQVNVDVIVLAGSPLMATGKDGKKEPRLDPLLFAVGARHLVCADSKQNVFLIEHNIWPATEEICKRIADDSKVPASGPAR